MGLQERRLGIECCLEVQVFRSIDLGEHQGLSGAGVREG